jgi:hypothetical protein
LRSGLNATDNTRRIAEELQDALTTANYATTMQLLHESEGQFTAPSRKYNWTTRLDYHRGERDFINGRFTLAREDNDQLRIDNAEAPSNGVIETLADYTAVGSWNHIFNDRLVNELRVQFAHNDYRQISRAPGSGQIVIAGLLNYGRLGTLPFVIKQKRYQFEDILNWRRGSKDFKFGVSYRPVDTLVLTEIGFQGTFTFAAGLPLANALSTSDLGSLTGPLAPPADTALTSLQAFNLGIPSLWQQGFGNPDFPAWQQNLGNFAQVTWKLKPGLTLNLGTRLNYDGEPQPLDRNFSISPRLGFAWDPFGKGETVIRGGFGTFFAPAGLQVLLAATLLDDNQFIISQTRSLQGGAQSSQALWAHGVSLGKLPFSQLTEQDIRTFGIIPLPGQPNRRLTRAADDYNNPYTVQASLGFSQQLGRDIALDVSFLMYHGVHLPVAIEGNYRESGALVTVPGMPGSDLFGPGLERIDPAIAQIVVHSAEGNSIYYGMTASVVKKFARNFYFRTSYTYSKAIDDTTDFNGGLTPYLPTRRFLERGLSSFDLRHNFVASGSFASPFDKGHNWTTRALANITLSPIITLRSGFPFNLFIGRDVNGDLNTTDRPFYAPRNSGVGENFYSVDLRLSKLIYFGPNAEGPRLEFNVEAVNLFNRVNYLRVNDVVCGTTSQPGFINGCDPKFLTGPFNFRGVPGLPPTAPLAFVISVRAEIRVLSEKRMAVQTGQFLITKILVQSLALVVVIIAACANSLVAQDAAKDAAANKKVLMLFGDDSNIATQVTVERALRSTLKNESSVPIEAYSEYVGNRRAGSDYEKELVALLKRKYEGKKFDVVFCIGQFPLSMALKNRAELFSGAPFVFLTIDRRNIAGLYPAPGLTGVWGEINFKANLQLALALHPGTKRVALIQGASEVDKFWANKAKEDFREFESRVEFSDLAGLTIPEMRNALADLPPDSVVFFI